jgi:hypothetical protein
VPQAQVSTSIGIIQVGELLTQYIRIELVVVILNGFVVGSGGWSISDQSEALWLVLSDLGRLLPGLCTGVEQGLGIRRFRLLLNRLVPRSGLRFKELALVVNF